MTSHSGYITTSTKMGLSGLHSSANMAGPAGVSKNELARFTYDTRGNYCLHCSWRWIYTVSEDYALMLMTRKPYHMAGRTKVSLTCTSVTVQHLAVKQYFSTTTKTKMTFEENKLISEFFLEKAEMTMIKTDKFSSTRRKLRRKYDRSKKK